MRPQPQSHQPRSVAKPISSLFSPQQTLNTKQTPSTEPVPPSLPQSHTKKFEHIRTSSFSATPPRLDSHPFKPPSFIGSNRPSNHRRHTSFNRYDVPETSSSMRYPNFDILESCELLPTCGNEGKGRLHHLQNSLLASKLSLNTETPFGISQISKILNGKPQACSLNTFLTDDRNQTNNGQSPFSKDIEFKEAGKAEISKIDKLSPYNVTIECETSPDKPRFKLVSACVDTEMAGQGENSGDFPRLPCPDFYEITQKHIETEERIMTEFGAERYQSPPPRKRERNYPSSREKTYIESPELLRQKSVEQQAKHYRNNYRSQCVSKEVENFTFESVAMENATNWSDLVNKCEKVTTYFQFPSHRQMLSERNQEQPFEETNSKGKEVNENYQEETNPLYKKSEFIVSEGSQKEQKEGGNRHNRSLSSHPVIKSQNTVEIVLKPYDSDLIDIHSQISISPHHVDHAPSVKAGCEGSHQYSGHIGTDSRRSWNKSPKEILDEAKKFEKGVNKTKESQSVTLQTIDLPDSFSQRIGSIRKTYDLPLQIKNLPPKATAIAKAKQEVNQRNPQPDQANLSYKSQQRNEEESQSSITRQYFSANERANQILQKIADKSQTSQSSHLAYPSGRSLIYSDKDSSKTTERTQRNFGDNLVKSFRREFQPSAPQSPLKRIEEVTQESKYKIQGVNLNIQGSIEVSHESSTQNFHPRLLQGDNKYEGDMKSPDRYDRAKEFKGLYGLHTESEQCFKSIQSQTTIFVQDRSRVSLQSEETLEQNSSERSKQSFESKKLKENPSVSSKLLSSIDENRMYNCHTLEELDFTQANPQTLATVEDLDQYQNDIINKIGNVHQEIIHKITSISNKMEHDLSLSESLSPGDRNLSINCNAYATAPLQSSNKVQEYIKPSNAIYVENYGSISQNKTIKDKPLIPSNISTKPNSMNSVNDSYHDTNLLRQIGCRTVTSFTNVENPKASRISSLPEANNNNTSLHMKKSDIEQPETNFGKFGSISTITRKSDVMTEDKALQTSINFVNNGLKETMQKRSIETVSKKINILRTIFLQTKEKMTSLPMELIEEHHQQLGSLKIATSNLSTPSSNSKTFKRTEEGGRSSSKKERVNLEHNGSFGLESYLSPKTSSRFPLIKSKEDSGKRSLSGKNDMRSPQFTRDININQIYQVSDFLGKEKQGKNSNMPYRGIEEIYSGYNNNLELQRIEKKLAKRRASNIDALSKTQDNLSQIEKVSLVSKDNTMVKEQINKGDVNKKVAGNWDTSKFYLRNLDGVSMEKIKENFGGEETFGEKLRSNRTQRKNGEINGGEITLGNRRLSNYC